MIGIGLAAHVFFGTLAFGFAIVLDFAFVAIAKTRRAEIVRRAYPALAPYVRWGGPLFLLAILIGFFEAARLHDTLTAPWLVATYALLVVGTVLGAGLVRRRNAAILAAAQRAGDAPSAEFERAVDAARPVGAWTMLAIMAAIVVLMIVKPGAG